MAGFLRRLRELAQQYEGKKNAFARVRSLSLYLFSRAGCGCVRAWEGERKGGGSSGRGGRERRSRARGGIFLSRLSRRRFISGSRKTNGEIVSKILTAHLGEHVALSPTRPPPFPPSSRAAPGC